MTPTRTTTSAAAMTTRLARSLPVGPSHAGIATLADLRRHLQWAIELEHATVPPYLCALYSLDPARNPEVVEIVGSVFVEEMLHLLLAANLLNAVGGRPRIDAPRMLAPYPRSLPHADGSFEVSLLPFGAEALEIFLKIEQPSAPCAAPESDAYQTIGQFYDAIERGMGDLCARLGEAHVFCGAPQRQVSATVGAGQVTAVDSLATARTALHQIVVQGEGQRGAGIWDGDPQMYHPERNDVGHYFRFLSLKLGRCYRRGDTTASGPTGDAIRIDWAGVRPMERNPQRNGRASASAVRTAQREFDVAYCTVLQHLDMTFDGRPEMLGRAIGAMFELKRQARSLMEMPTDDGCATAGPTFEYIAPADRIRA